MGCSPSLISKDMSYITKAAQTQINKHIEEKLPVEHQKTVMLYEEIKNRAVEISNNTTHDRDKIAALALAKDCGESLYELNTEGRHIKKAIKAAAGLKEKLEELEDREDEEIEEVQFYRPVDDHE